MRYKFRTLFALSLGIAIPAVHAKPPVDTESSEHSKKGNDQKPYKLNDLQQQLSLTNDQVAKITVILKEEHAAVKELKDASKEDRSAGMKKAHALAATKIRALLTTEQQVRFI